MLLVWKKKDAKDAKRLVKNISTCYLLMCMLSLFYFQGVIIGVTPNYLVALRSYQVPGGLPGVIFCKVVGSSYFVFVLGKVSCLTVTCLALERWYSVVKPIKYRLTFKRQRVYVYLVIIWITCLLLHSLILFQMTLDEKNLRCMWITSDFPKQLTPMLLTIMTFFLPNAVTWATFLHLSLALKKSPAIKNNGPFARARLKLLRMCVIVALLFTICWFPNQLYYVLSSYGLVRLESPSHRFTVVLAMFNSCINPVIYCSTHRDYRKRFLSLFRCVFNSWLCKKRREISLPKEHRLRSMSGESEAEKFGGGVVLTSFRDLINQGYEVDNCSQQETSGVWIYFKNLAICVLLENEAPRKLVSHRVFTLDLNYDRSSYPMLLYWLFFGMQMWHYFTIFAIYWR